MVEGRKVLFYDVGANAGIYSLTVATAAKATSKILAYEPNPEMQRRFARNIGLNNLKTVTLRPVALGEAPGKAVLNVSSFGNLGQASLAHEGAGIEVEVACLTDELIAPKGYDLSFMKIDVEGAEAMVLRPALAARGVHWPDVIMMEHKSADDWGMDLFAELARHGYAPRVTTRHNTFLYRERD
jgi:FkbM family methyltransferase